MDDENEEGRKSGDEGQGDDNDKSNTRDDRRREALSRRAKAAEEKAATFESKVGELEDQIAELSGKSGNVDKMIERLQSKVQKAETERDEAKGLLSSERSGRRTGSLVERLAADTGVPATRLRGLLMSAKADDPDLDIAPDSIDDGIVKSYRKLLTSIDPDSFTSKETGKSRPRPGPAPREHQRGLADSERPSADRLTALLANPIFQPPKDGRPI